VNLQKRIGLQNMDVELKRLEPSFRFFNFTKSFFARRRPFAVVVLLHKHKLI